MPRFDIFRRWHGFFCASERRRLKVNQLTVGRPLGIIIFNWDDTLLCTSFLTGETLTTNSALPTVLKDSFGNDFPAVPTVSPQLLRRLEEIARTLLSEAMRLGRTYIVTNSRSGWVEESAAKYMPGLLPVLQDVTVISARSAYEQEYPEQKCRWKAEAFLKIATESGPESVKDLMIVGDSDIEMKAADVVGSILTDWRIKVIKMRQNPSAQDLLMEHRLVLRNLETFTDSDKSLTITLERTTRA